jgi:hypothetical protein
MSARLPEPAMRSTFDRPPRRPSRRERGIAILSVITVLVALLIIAIPFVISMKLGRDRTQSNAYRNRARFEAEEITRAIASYAHRTHPAFEQQRKMSGGTGEDADDTYDSSHEFTPTAEYRDVIAREFARDASGGTASVADPRGSIWSWRITDCNGLVNPNGASPYLLGNLLGSAVLSSDLDPGATNIRVENVQPLNAPGGSPFKRDGGYIRIGAETIRYKTFDPAEGFQGCERGALKDAAPLLDNGLAAQHKRGAIVIDYVAYKLATRVLAAKPGEMAPFRNLEEMKTIQAWGGGGVLDADRFEALVPFLTVWSRRETAESFLDGQIVLNPLPQVSKDTGGEVVRFRDKDHIGATGQYYNAGTLVRITDGRQAHYGVIAHAGDETGSQTNVLATLANHLPDGVTYEGARARIEPLAPYPIDINTAPREVLAACFAHLRTRDVDDAKLIVTPALAWDLAGRIVTSREGPFVADAGEGDRRRSGPFRRGEDFDRWLADLQKQGAIGAKQREALLRNALNPHDNDLAFGTAPFCYRTLDVYSIEGRAVVNDAGGSKAAEAAVRRIVEIGSDSATMWTVDSQADFELGFTLGTGAKYVETYPFNVAFVNDDKAHTQPRIRAPQWIQREIYPSPERSVDLGDVRLQAARIDLPGKPVVKDHMDMSIYAEGWQTEQAGPYVRPVKGTIAKDESNGTWMQPFTISLWMRSYSRGNFWVFDSGRDNADQNRISLFVRDGDNGKELTFRVCDATLQGTGAEIYVPLDRIGYKPETWYHLQATARGADPAQMELFVDGVSVGKRRGLTYLAATLSVDATSMAVEDLQGFETAGAVMVGDEAIEYDESGGTSLNKLYRGMRGTTPKDWPAGTPVRRLGYSHPLLLDLRKGGAGLEAKRLIPWGFMQIASFTKEVDLPVVDPNGTAYLFTGLPDTERTDTVTLQKITRTDGATKFETANEQDQVDTFSSQGFALLVSTTMDTTGGTTPPPSGAAVPSGMAGPQGAVQAADAPPTPGGGVPGGGGRPSDPTPPAPQPPPNPGGGTPGGPAPSGPGGSGGSTRPPMNSAGSLPKIGGWEVVWYRKVSGQAQLEIERYQTTAWHTDAGPFFAARQVKQGTNSSSRQVKAWIAPISILGTSLTSQPDYLDPGTNGEDRDRLGRYGTDGNPDDTGLDRYNWPRIVVGTKDGAEKEGAVECIRYDSINRQKLSGSLVFVRDEEAALQRLQHQLIPYYLVWNPNSGRSAPPAGPTAPTGGSGAPARGGSPAGGAVLASFSAPVAGGAGRLLASVPGDDEPAPEPGGGDSPPNPTPGGSVPAGTGGRELPPDDSGGGGSEPASGNGEGGTTAPPSGTRPPADPPPADSGSGGGSGSNNGNDIQDPFKREGDPEDPPYIRDVTPVYPFRGVNDTLGASETPGLFHTNQQAGDDDSLLLPCFRVLRKDKDTGIRVNGGPPGYNDVVTITTGDVAPRREQRRIRWAHNVAAGGRSSNWLALTQFIEGDAFKAETADADLSRIDVRGHVRLMKFPSGELPDELGENLTFGKNEVGHGGVVRAFLDELYVYRQPNPVGVGVVANNDTIRSDTADVVVRAVPPATSIQSIDGYDKDCGVLAIGGELIVWRGTSSSGADTVTFERCARGCFGTKAAPHGVNEPVRIVPELYVSYLAGTLTRDSASVPMGRTRNWPREGLVRILSDDSAELVHYTSRNDTDLLLPESMDADESTRGRGLTRGRFGTEITSHQNDELVLWQPFRYWDRYFPRRGSDRATFAGVHESPEACSLGLAKTVYQAQWRRVSWQENLDGRTRGDDDGRRKGGNRTSGERAAPQKLDLIVLARFDQSVPWDADRSKILDLRGSGAGIPQAARDHPERFLYLFDDPDSANRLDLEADTAEFRVFFPYLQGAFVPQDLAKDARDRDTLEMENAWKQTPWLRSFSVEYVNRTKERYSAEIR